MGFRCRRDRGWDWESAVKGGESGKGEDVETGGEREEEQERKGQRNGVKEGKSGNGEEGGTRQKRMGE